MEHKKISYTDRFFFGGEPNALQEGVTIAVDPDVIPLGSWVEINGHQYHAEDTGAFSGNHIDIYFDDHDEAWEFGRQHANVRWYPGC